MKAIIRFIGPYADLKKEIDRCRGDDGYATKVFIRDCKVYQIPNHLKEMRDITDDLMIKDSLVKNTHFYSVGYKPK